MFRQIMVPLDGSAHAEHALPVALSIAEQCGAVVHVTLVHVPDAYDDYISPQAEDLEREATDRERAYLDALGRRLVLAFRGEAQFHHLEGIVPETLAAEVSMRQIDLVVMNAHGWGFTSRVILGSVSDYLMRRVDVPLLLMRSQTPSTEMNRRIAFRRILVPLNGSQLSEAILAPATRLGGLWGAQYQFVQVVPPAEHWIPLSVPVEPDDRIAEHARRHANAYLEKTATDLRRQGATVETRVVFNRNVAAALVEETVASSCDLIAISTHARGGLPRLLLGSVADKVIRAAHTPVLVFRPTPAT